jgi:hypothetical protein
LGLVGYSLTKGPEMVTVEVLSEPSGANVYVDGKLVGASPATVELADQSNAKVTLEAEGFKRREELVTASKGMQFSLKLEPLEVVPVVQPQEKVEPVEVKVEEPKPEKEEAVEEAAAPAEKKVVKKKTTPVKKTETRPADNELKMTR